MLTGAGAPAAIPGLGTQQMGGGWSAGLAMLWTSGMYSGWCGATAAPLEPATSRRPASAASKAVACFMDPPLLRDGEWAGDDRRAREALAGLRVERVLAGGGRREGNAPAGAAAVEAGRDRVGEGRIVERDLHRAGQA